FPRAPASTIESALEMLSGENTTLPLEPFASCSYVDAENRFKPCAGPASAASRPPLRTDTQIALQIKVIRVIEQDSPTRKCPEPGLPFILAREFRDTLIAINGGWMLLRLAALAAFWTLSCFA